VRVMDVQEPAFRPYFLSGPERPAVWQSGANLTNSDASHSDNEPILTVLVPHEKSLSLYLVLY
jgi:hypothetical protein